MAAFSLSVNLSRSSAKLKRLQRLLAFYGRTKRPTMFALPEPAIHHQPGQCPLAGDLVEVVARPYDFNQSPTFINDLQPQLHYGLIVPQSLNNQVATIFM